MVPSPATLTNVIARHPYGNPLQPSVASAAVKIAPGLFMACPWQPTAMPETTPDDDIEATIAFALSQIGYDPPRKSSPAGRALYFRVAACTIRQHLAHAGVVTRQPRSQRALGEWKPGNRRPWERQRAASIRS
jgi:hypothetical protein